MTKTKFWLLTLTTAFAMGASAQNTWETPAEKQQQEQTTAAKPLDEKALALQKYLAGAVPEVDGKVVFTKEFSAPNRTAFEIYNLLGKFMQDMTLEEGQLNSKLITADTTTFQLGAVYEEWLVFQKSFISLDRTRFNYVLLAHCENGKATVELSHIKYLYEEERKPQKYTAEEWITDKEALNKKKTRLLPFSGKFRRKTIDRKDYIFNQIEALLK